MNNAARTVFQNSELLRHLDGAGLDRVARVAVRRSYEQGATIFAEGDPGDAIFGVITGQVRITAKTSENQEIFLVVIGSGGVFGESAVIDGLPRCGSARAAMHVDVFRICRDGFTRLMAADPQVSLGLLHVLCRHQRLATRLIVDQYAQGQVSVRLAHRVLALTSENGSAGRPDCSLHITQADLAKFIFASRQVVNLHLSDWESRGWVAISRCRLVVIDREALAQVAKNHDSGA